MHLSSDWKMKLYVLFVYFFTFFLRPTSADDPFEGLFKLGEPCFGVIKSNRCGESLADSFKPQSPLIGNNKPDTKVFLFTPTNPDEAELLHECGGALSSESKYDSEVDTEIFIHGWLDGVCRTAWMREMKEQYYRRGRYNIILVDWTWGNTDRFLAIANCKIVGEQVGFIINNIMNQTKTGPEKFHMIGHSLGVIASGFVGRSVKGLRRITALDPSWTGFGDAPPDQRVTYRDAKIVDVIHSNGGNCSAQSSGDARQLGHADFYPNGGMTQLSCYSYILPSFLKGDFLYALVSLLPQMCSHLQSIQYYKVSINSKGCEFNGTESNSYEDFTNGRNNGSWAIMGMNYEQHHEPGSRKKFYLKTCLTCPYAKKSSEEGMSSLSKQNCCIA